MTIFLKCLAILQKRQTTPRGLRPQVESHCSKQREEKANVEQRCSVINLRE